MFSQQGQQVNAINGVQPVVIERIWNTVGMRENPHNRYKGQ